MKDRLKKIREKLGKTQKEMGALVSVHERAWQKYEKGANIPGGEVLQALADLGFNINWILTGKGDMHEHEGEKTVTYGTNKASVDQVNTHEAYLSGTEEQTVMNAVTEVMKGPHHGVKLALTQNALMFQEMVRMANEIIELRRDLDAIRRQLLGPRETDFKTLESQGEKTSKAGGGTGD